MLVLHAATYLEHASDIFLKEGLVQRVGLERPAYEKCSAGPENRTDDGYGEIVTRSDARNHHVPAEGRNVSIHILLQPSTQNHGHLILNCQ